MTAPTPIPARILMGPGPSNTSPAVLAAAATPTIGHLDPAFQTVMEEVKDNLRYAFRTENAITFPMSAPASLAMEAAFVNLLEPGDTAIIAQNGVFGGRMAEIARRCDAHVVVVASEWGRPVDVAAVNAAIIDNPQAKLLGFVHAETSTGALSDAAALCALARVHGLLSVMDTVTGLGGAPVEVDAWGADFTYSGAQKCLSVPPGLAPVTISPRAASAIRARKTPVRSWFADLSLIMGYWDGEGGRSYHHTAPVNAIFGLAEGLRALREEGLEAAFARHRAAHERLARGLDALGLEFLVDPAHRLPQLNAVRIPQGVDDAFARARLLNEFGIEIGAGLGPLAGRVWRIGLMGHTARAKNVDACLAGLAEIIGDPARRAA